MSKIFLTFTVAISLLSGCTATSGNKNADGNTVTDRTLPTGSYLPRKKSQVQDAATVDKTQLENMQRMGAGTIQTQ